MYDFNGTKIGIAGLGLIGGSLAKAFKKAAFYVAGFDHDSETIDEALKSGAFDAASCDAQPILECDILFIALYPDDIIKFVRDNAAVIKKGSLVIDCCGVKEYITSAVTETAKLNGFYFIGGHPMAGTEKRGFLASDGGLFSSASFILTPTVEIPQAIKRKAEAVIETAGFKCIVVTDPAHHDRMIAFTSQLPHVLACAYVKSPLCPQHKGYSAGSYRDVSRVAHINPELWSELFIDNGPALCEEIDRLIGNLAALRDAVAKGDRDDLSDLLLEALKIKDGVDLAI